MELIDQLKNIDLFKNLRTKELFALIEDSEIHQISPEKHILKKGEKDSNLKIIIKGEAYLYRADQTKVTLGPGAYFGELNLLKESTVQADILASSEVDILVLPYDEIHRCYSADLRVYGVLMENLARLLSTRLKKAGETIHRLTSSNK